jgi:hypothetical protein
MLPLLADPAAFEAAHLVATLLVIGCAVTATAIVLSCLWTGGK